MEDNSIYNRGGLIGRKYNGCGQVHGIGGHSDGSRRNYGGHSGKREPLRGKWGPREPTPPHTFSRWTAATVRTTCQPRHR